MHYSAVQCSIMQCSAHQHFNNTLGVLVVLFSQLESFLGSRKDSLDVVENTHTPCMPIPLHWLLAAADVITQPPCG